MWTLSEARTKLGERLAEESTVFWSETIRNNAINEAQRFISAVTRGIPQTLTGNVDDTTPYVTVTGTLLAEYVTSGRVDDGAALRPVAMDVADTVDPDWRTRTGTPRWVVVDSGSDRVYVTPAPTTSTAITVNVAVLPADMTSDSEELFDGVSVMEQYQGALLNIAASLCLLRERYDGDAERFFQFAMQELQALGVDPARIPRLSEVAKPQ